jgi:hypothetical protein
MYKSPRTALKRLAETSSFNLATTKNDQVWAAAGVKSSRFSVYRRNRAGLQLEDLVVERRGPALHAASSAELCS